MKRYKQDDIWSWRDKKLTDKFSSFLRGTDFGFNYIFSTHTADTYRGKHYVNLHFYIESKIDNNLKLNDIFYIIVDEIKELLKEYNTDIISIYGINKKDTVYTFIGNPLVFGN